MSAETPTIGYDEDHARSLGSKRDKASLAQGASNSTSVSPTLQPKRLTGVKRLFREIVNGRPRLGDLLVGVDYVYSNNHRWLSLCAVEGRISQFDIKKTETTQRLGEKLLTVGGCCYSVRMRLCCGCLDAIAVGHRCSRELLQALFFADLLRGGVILPIWVSAIVANIY